MRVLAIVRFQTDRGNRYVYDDNTGMVFPASDSLVDLLEAHQALPLEEAAARLAERYDTRELQADAAFIRHWSDVYGAFYRPETLPPDLAARMRNVSPEEVDRQLAGSGTRQMILVLTEDCNLRCRYCVYSDAYSRTRNRTTARMPVDVGRRAIDYFFERAARTLPRNPAMRFVISFYGGEPLMAHDALRELVLYAEAHAPCPLLFAMTTNGTLLGSNIADFLVDHGFHILVSVDGPRDNHDRNRVFANDTGSHDVVVGNLRQFQARHPGYPNVHLISVWDWGTDIDALERFFEEDARDLPTLQRVGPVVMEDTDYYAQFSDEQRKAYRRSLSRIERDYYRAEAEHARPTRVGRLLSGISALGTVARRRSGDGLNPLLPFTGACIPGAKLAVRADGTFDLCERVNGTQPIGHVDTGIDFERAAALMREYNAAVGSHCWTCPVTKLCATCMATHNTDGKFERQAAICEGMRAGAERRLSQVYSVFEVRPDAFAEFNDINADIQFITS